MKISPLLVLLAASAPLTSHAQTDDAPDVAALPLAPKSAATSDAFVWRFEPPVGSQWTMRSFTRTASNVQTPATGSEKSKAIRFTAIQKIVADYDIVSRDALGATTIRLTLREMTSDMNSLVDGKANTTPMAAKTDPRAVAGATLLIKQSRDGKVWGVSGLRAFQRKILEASGTLDKATIKQILDASPMKGDGELLRSLSQMPGGLPASPVRVSESWNYTMNLPATLPFALDITGTRTLKSLSADSALIADSATLNGGNAASTLPATPDARGITFETNQLNGTLSGTTRVQRSSGLPLETNVNLTLSGQFTTQIPATQGAKAQRVTVPLDMMTATRMILQPR